MIWQTEFSIAVTGASDGAALTRPDRVDGVSIALPKELWGWYDGRTSVTLPSGGVITPPARTYLKYNPDAFKGRVVTTPNGRIVADQFWYGNSAITLDEFRTDNRFNLDMSIRRTIGLINGMQLEIGADAMNLLITHSSAAHMRRVWAEPSPHRTRPSAWCPGWATPRISAPGEWQPSTRVRSSCGRS